MSLRATSAELAARGHLNERGANRQRIARGSAVDAVTGLPALITVMMPEPSVTRAVNPMPTTSVAQTIATATTFRWVMRLAVKSEKLFTTPFPKGPSH